MTDPLRLCQKLYVGMALAHDLSRLSRAKLGKVGCVVADVDFTEVLGMGYNGRAPGEDDSVMHDDPDRPSEDLHAEVNALMKVDRTARRAVMMVTRPPCFTCAGYTLTHGAVVGLIVPMAKERLNDREGRGVRRLINGGVSVLMDDGTLARWSERNERPSAAQLNEVEDWYARVSF